ncbi:hypothetical protein BAE44_0015692 [Dichanthelium oligosanthes]|uniref:DUF1618 domain-containing protein n=1 Tax=Dichanthelium oligosanthes TaxID=888268 RepID=A0A1E5VDS2_9POAL|nr:hypothetical protein BAE44_0015692 [Dichanthelium oligosanthes]
MSSGNAIRATFCTAAPPLVSYMCVWCPDLPPTKLAMEPTVEAAEAELVLFRVSLSGCPSRRSYFVYKATGGEGRSSLRRVEDPDPYMLYRHSTALLPRPRDVGVGEDGGPSAHTKTMTTATSTSPHSITLPCRMRASTSGSTTPWTSSTVPLVTRCIHITAKVIALGEEGLVGFVDPWRGILVCDLLRCKWEHYLPLPQHLIRLDKLRDEPLLSRDIASVNGRLTLVDLNRSAAGTDSSSDCLSWDVSTWSISSPWEEQDGWRKDYMINTRGIIIDDETANADLLPKVENNGATTPQPSIGSHFLAHPTLSLSDNRVVYLMGKADSWDKSKKALVLST